jgi:hypothetical protein
MNADEIVVWNRAAMRSGGPSPREGNVALSALLCVHGLIMNGGVRHAMKAVTKAELHASCAGFRYFGFSEVAELLEAASKDERRDKPEGRLDGAYGELVDDAAITDRFANHMRRNRELYAP